MSEPDYEPTDGPGKESSSSYDANESTSNASSSTAGRVTRRSATRKSVEFDLSDSASSRGPSSRHSSRLTSTSSSVSLSKEEKDTKKVVAVKPSMAPVQELGNSYPDWSVLERELEAAKTLENAYFLDSSFLHALTAMDLWLSSEGPFFMPRREFRHRHCIFNLFWQPSAPNWEKSEYVVPPRLNGLLRWYLTRDNFINKEAGNRLQDITERLPQEAQTALIERGWSLYIMNMVYISGNQLIFRKDNEKEYQPYFGSTAKSQLRGSLLPELSEDAFEALCRRLAPPHLLPRILALPNLTLGPLSPAAMHEVRSSVDSYRAVELVILKRNAASKSVLGVGGNRKKKGEANAVGAPASSTSDGRNLHSDDLLAAGDDGLNMQGRSISQPHMRAHLSHLSSRPLLPSPSNTPSSRASLSYGMPESTSMWTLDNSASGEPYSLDDSSGASLGYGAANLATPGSPMGSGLHHLHGGMSPIPQVLSRAGRNTSRAMHNLHQIQDADGPQPGTSPLKMGAGGSVLGASTGSNANLGSSGHSGLTSSASHSNPSLHHSGSHISGFTSSSTSSSTLSSSSGAILSNAGHQPRDISDSGVSLLGHSTSSGGSGQGASASAHRGSPKSSAAPRTSRGGALAGRGSGKDTGTGAGSTGSPGSGSISTGLDAQGHERREMSSAGTTSGSSGVAAANTLTGSKSPVKRETGLDRSGIGGSGAMALGSNVGGTGSIVGGSGTLASSGGRKRSSGHASLLDAESVASGANEDGGMLGSTAGHGGVGNKVGGVGGNEMISTSSSASDPSVPRSVKRRKLASSTSDSTTLHTSGTSSASGGVGIGGSLSRTHSPAPSSVHLSSSTSAISASHGPHMHQSHTPSSLGYPHRRGALSSSSSNDRFGPAPESSVNTQDLLQLELGLNSSLQQASQSLASCMRKMMQHGVLASHFPFLQERFNQASTTLYMLSEEFESYSSSLDAASGGPLAQNTGMPSPQQPQQSPQHSRAQSYASLASGSPSSSNAMMMSNGVSSPQNSQAQGSSSLPRSLFDHSLPSNHPRNLVQQHALMHQQQQQQQQQLPQHHQSAGYDGASLPLKNAAWPPPSPYGDLYHHPPPHSYFVPPHLFNSPTADLTGALNMASEVEPYSLTPLVHSFQPSSITNSSHSHYHSSSYGPQSASTAPPILAGNAPSSGSQNQGSQSQGSTSSGPSQQSQGQSGGNSSSSGQRDSQTQQQTSSSAGAPSAPPPSKSPAPSVPSVQVSQQQTSSTTTQSSSSSSSQHGLHSYDFGNNASFFPSPPHPSYGSKAATGTSGAVTGAGNAANTGAGAQGPAGAYFSASSSSSTTATDSSSSEAFATYVYQHTDPSTGMHYSPFQPSFGHMHHLPHGHNDQAAASTHNLNPHQMEEYHHKKQQPPQYY